MSLPAMLGMLTGGAQLPPLADLITIPCALCIADRNPEPRRAVTLREGNAACRECTEGPTGTDALAMAGTLATVALATATATNPDTAAMLEGLLPDVILRCGDDAPHATHYYSALVNGHRAKTRCPGVVA